MEKKMKKPLFNGKLYLEGMRQLKLIGIMSAIIMALAAFLIPLGYQINNAEYVTYVNRYPAGTTGRIVSYGILELNPLIVLTFLIIVPLMTLYLFNFLNRRNACDFYHSIPDTRESIFTSFGAAILTWNVGLILGSVLISVISCGIFHYVELEAGDMAVVICASVVACIFMYGVFLIAMSLTGTNFTNLTVATMILIVPRLVATVFMAIISDSIAVIPFQFGGSILDDRLNVVTNLFTGLFIRGYVQGIKMWGSVLYTLIVGIVYCILGLFFFKRRKSEVATCAALNSKLQCVLRLIPAMMICLIPIAMIFRCVIEGYDLDNEEIFGIVVLYIIAIIAYFLYELITTKKLRNALKAIPGLAWLVVFNVLFGVALYSSYTVMLNDVPAVEDVKSVCVEMKGEYDYETRNYYQNRINQIELTSPEIREIVVTELARNVAAIKAGESIWNYQVERNLDTYNYEQRTRVVLSVKMDCGLTNKYRKIYLSEPAFCELTDLFANNEQINKVLYETVDFKEISYMYLTHNNTEIPLESLYQIYQSYNEELKKLSFADAFSAVIRDDFPEHSVWYGYLDIGLKNGEEIRIQISDVFPETLGLYFKIINENVKEEPMDAFFRLVDEKDAESTGSIDRNGNVSFSVYDGWNYYTPSAWFYAYRSQDGMDEMFECDYTENGEAVLRQIQEKLKECNAADGTKKSMILEVDFIGNIYEGDGDNYQRIVKYYEADEELLRLIQRLGGYNVADEPATRELSDISGYLTGWVDNHTIEISTEKQEFMALQVLDEKVAAALSQANPGDIVCLLVGKEELEAGGTISIVEAVNDIVPMEENAVPAKESEKSEIVP